MKDKRLYIAIIYIAIISIILSYYSWPLGIACMVLGMYITFSIYRMEKKRQENWSNYIKELSEDIDVATKNAVMSIPMPLVVLNDEGIVIWHNKIFRDLIGQGDILDENILDFLPDLDLEKILINRENLNERMLYKDQWYDIIPAFVDTDKGSENQSPLTFLYMRNITEKMRLKGIYDREQIVIVDIQIDNYDEVMANTEDTKRPALLAQIDGKLSKWASSLDASWRKYDRDKFLVIMEKGRLEEIEKDKFQILDVVREIDAGNKIPVTLSIGVGVGGSVPSECNSYARSAMDLALGRGGDQAVVKHGDKLFFYGGKTRAVEKSSKVKSRVIANALRHLMAQATNIFIMGHEVPDLDSIGAAMGIYRCARHLDKTAYIIEGADSSSIVYLMEKILREDEYKYAFIDDERALERVDHKSLLVVVDTHRPSFTEMPKLIEKVGGVVVIDHHRRSTEMIKNPVLSYLEPYASSTSELVTEIVQYFDDRVRLNDIEANALLAGITMDTKNFTFKTGVRTFEAASYLRRRGADPTAIRQLLQDNMKAYIARAETVKNAVVIEEGIVMSESPEGAENAPLIAAQAADTLLTIHGIHTSFVLSKRSDHILISGRSMGNVNVQIVLEKLGGGGHLTIAGAQLKNIGMEKARAKLIEALTEYLEEGDR